MRVGRICLLGGIMGRKEEPILWFYEKNPHFAGLLNGWLFSGKEGIRYRVIIGTELQSYIDYGMPLRVMDYDAMDYRRQADALRRERQQNIPGKVSLSTLQKEDRLTPVCTLVLYLGEDPWDAAESLHGLLDFSGVPETLKLCVPDYSIQVLDVCHTEDAKLMEFPEDIACMFLLIKYQKDKGKLAAMIREIEGFSRMSEDAYETVSAYTNEKSFLDIKEQVRNEEGGSNMWVAFRELMEDSKTEGKVEGIREGKAAGIREGRSRSVLTLLGELGTVSDDLREKISGENDTTLLENWLKLSARAQSVEDFRRQAQI